MIIPTSVLLSWLSISVRVCSHMVLKCIIEGMLFKFEMEQKMLFLILKFGVLFYIEFCCFEIQI